MIDLDPRTNFVQFYPKVASYFLSWGKNKNVTLGMRLLWNTLEYQNLYTGNRYILCHNCRLKKYSEFKAELFGVIMRKIWAWHQKALLPVEPWGMRMQWEHTTLTINTYLSQMKRFRFRFFFFHFRQRLRGNLKKSIHYIYKYNILDKISLKKVMIRQTSSLPLILRSEDWRSPFDGCINS